jgi:hypothetical protein
LSSSSGREGGKVVIDLPDARLTYNFVTKRACPESTEWKVQIMAFFIVVISFNSIIPRKMMMIMMMTTNTIVMFRQRFLEIALDEIIPT